MRLLVGSASVHSLLRKVGEVPAQGGSRPPRRARRPPCDRRRGGRPRATPDRRGRGEVANVSHRAARRRRVRTAGEAAQRVPSALQSCRHRPPACARRRATSPSLEESGPRTRPELRELLGHRARSREPSRRPFCGVHRKLRRVLGVRPSSVHSTLHKTGVARRGHPCPQAKDGPPLWDATSPSLDGNRVG